MKQLMVGYVKMSDILTPEQKEAFSETNAVTYGDTEHTLIRSTRFRHICEDMEIVIDLAKDEALAMIEEETQFAVMIDIEG